MSLNFNTPLVISLSESLSPINDSISDPETVLSSITILIPL